MEPDLADPLTASRYPPAIRDEFQNDLDDDHGARIKAELEPGELVLWAGSPSPPPERFGWGYFFFGALASLLFLLGTAVIADAFGRFGRRPPEQSTLVGGLTFYGFAGAILFGIIANAIKTRSERQAAGNVFYVVTDRRTISWVPVAGTDGVRVRSLPRNQIVDVMRVERADGSGTLELVCSEPVSRYHFHTNQFKDIAEVRRVELIVRKNLIAALGPANARERAPESFT